MSYLNRLQENATGKKGCHRSPAGTENEKKYKYSPLSEEAGEIRLLTLLPGEFSEEVEIKLHTYPLKPDVPVPLYHALSYAWGDAEKIHRVCVRDPSGSKYISITRNLAEALPYLRHETEALVFWIDAISVNQEDLDERSSQVKKMAEVYSQADNVVVWLGRGRDGSDYVMDLAARIGPKIDLDQTLAVTSIKPECDIEDEDRWWFGARDVLEDFPSKKVMVVSLENLFDRSWFKRLWVCQEITLARNAVIVCGSRALPWSEFRNFSLFFYLHCPRTVSEKTRNNLTHISMFFRCELVNGPQSVREVMESTKTCECSDERDRLYGIFNLLNRDDDNLVKIEPNYSKTVSDVYREFAMANYEKAGDLDIMHFCKMFPEKAKKEVPLPSWVPDWSSRGKATSLWGILFATANSKAFVSSTTSDRNLLEVTGKFCAMIDNKKELLHFDTLDESAGRGISIRQAIMDIAPKDVLCQQYPPMRKKTLLEAFTRTILNTFEDDYLRRFDTLPPFSVSENVVARLLQNRELSIEEQRVEDQVIPRTSNVFQNNSFFTTEEGYIGLAPDTAAPGDVLVVLLGLDSPILLRPTKNGYHKVVGTCYVYGLMSTEALLGPLPGDMRTIGHWNESVGDWSCAFIDDETHQVQTNDPRLGPLPQGWHFAPEKVCKERRTCPPFCREDTGEVTKFDPRLTPEALKERDPQLDLRVFKLI